MNKGIIKRVIDEAYYIVDTGETVRELATVFGVSKSTVHKDLHERLQDIDYNLYLNVRKVLDYHTNIRHIRGGESTRKKYLNLSN